MQHNENTDTKLYGPNEKVEDQIDQDADITTEEREILDNTDNNSGEEDDEQLARASMDNTDEDGEPLNEKGFGEDYSGDDLDIPRDEDKEDDDDEIDEEDDE